MSALKAHSLQCRRGGRLVFSDVEFSVSSGQALAVTGRNGAGKSSLLRLIAGLLPVAAGRVTLEGGDDERTVGEQAHYLGHQDALKPSLSVEENLKFWIDYLGGTGTTAGALEAAGLGNLATLPAAYLSAGQRRRLSLARLVAIRRPLWLLDEPSSTLDRHAQEILVQFMRAHLADGGLIVAATHSALGIDGVTELPLGAPQ